MSTPPIRIQISGDDSQLNAILARALANVKSFGAEAGAGGEKMTRSFSEARGAVALLNEELGTGLGRHLRTIIASSELLGPALELAFPIAAAVGFFEVLKNVGEKLGDWYYGAESLKQFGEQVKSTTELLVKLSGETNKLNRQAAGAGVSAQQQWAVALEEATKKAVQADKAARDLSDIIYSLGPNGQQTNVLGNTAEDIPALQQHLAVLVDLSAHAHADQANAQAQLNVAQRAGIDEYNKKLEEAKKKAEELRKEFQSILKEVSQSPAFFNLPSLARVRNQQNPLALDQQNTLQQIPTIDPAIAEKALARFKELQAIFAETRTPAELLASSIQHLNDLFRGDTSSELYRRAVEQIRDKYDEARQAVMHFGEEAGAALKQGLLMGRSWKDVLDSILVSLAQLIVKMYVLKICKLVPLGRPDWADF